MRGPVESGRDPGRGLHRALLLGGLGLAALMLGVAYVTLYHMRLADAAVYYCRVDAREARDLDGVLAAGANRFLLSLRMLPWLDDTHRRARDACDDVVFGRALAMVTEQRPDDELRARMLDEPGAERFACAAGAWRECAASTIGAEREPALAMWRGGPLSAVRALALARRDDLLARSAANARHLAASLCALGDHAGPALLPPTPSPTAQSGAAVREACDPGARAADAHVTPTTRAIRFARGELEPHTILSMPRADVPRATRRAALAAAVVGAGERLAPDEYVALAYDALWDTRPVCDLAALSAPVEVPLDPVVAMEASARLLAWAQRGDLFASYTRTRGESPDALAQHARRVAADLAFEAALTFAAREQRDEALAALSLASTHGDHRCALLELAARRVLGEPRAPPAEASPALHVDHALRLRALGRDADAYAHLAALAGAPDAPEIIHLALASFGVRLGRPLPAFYGARTREPAVDAWRRIVERAPGGDVPELDLFSYDLFEDPAAALFVMDLRVAATVEYDALVYLDRHASRDDAGWGELYLQRIALRETRPDAVAALETWLGELGHLRRDPVRALLLGWASDPWKFNDQFPDDFAWAPDERSEARGPYQAVDGASPLTCDVMRLATVASTSARFVAERLASRAGVFREQREYVADRFGVIVGVNGRDAPRLVEDVACALSGDPDVQVVLVFDPSARSFGLGAEPPDPRTLPEAPMTRAGLLRARRAELTFRIIPPLVRELEPGRIIFPARLSSMRLRDGYAVVHERRFEDPVAPTGPSRGP